MGSDQQKKIKIVVDAGHGSNTAGKRTPPMPYDIDFDQDKVIDVKKGEPIKEHIANVGVCIILEQELTRNGFTVVRSGWNDKNAYDDEDIPIEDRQSAIRKESCDYSVSVHFNAFGNSDEFNNAEGICTYIHSIPERIKDSENLAVIVQKYLAQGTKQVNRGVNRGNFGMVNCIGLNTKASVLVELAFMTNLKEATTLMGNFAFWKESAIEICKGFCEYTNRTYVPEIIPMFTVQVGAYRVYDNAAQMLNTVKKAGYKDAFIKNEKLLNGSMYRVQVGAYSVYNNATNMLANIKKSGYDAFIKTTT